MSEQGDDAVAFQMLLKAEAKRWPRPRSGWTAFRANLRLWWEQGWFPWHLS